MTTVLISLCAARKFLKRKCCTAEPEHEYTDNIITPIKLPAAPAPPPGDKGKDLYNNIELETL
jgi:hypothetical protein